MPGSYENGVHPDKDVGVPEISAQFDCALDSSSVTTATAQLWKGAVRFAVVPSLVGTNTFRLLPGSLVLLAASGTP